MKKISLALTLCILFALTTACTQTLSSGQAVSPSPEAASIPTPLAPPAESTESTCPHAIMYQNTWYVTYTEETSSTELADLIELGTIQSLVPSSEMPRENFQTNAKAFLGCTLWQSGMDLLLESNTPGVYYLFYDHGSPSKARSECSPHFDLHVYSSSRRIYYLRKPTQPL